MITEELKNKLKTELTDQKEKERLERIEAFIKLDRKDPVEYIDGWETAKKHVTKLLKNY